MSQTKVIVVQTDNRPTLDYLLLTKKVNENACKLLNYKYTFINMNNNILVHPATYKINIMSRLLNIANEDIVVFLDSDAWIQNPTWLKEIIDRLVVNKTKQGCFSRDPYFNLCTFINSGSFILKINNYTKNMYKKLIYTLYTDEKNSMYRNNWPWDQFYISNYVYKHKNNFIIFKPYVINTPGGHVLRHNWWKNKIMFEELNKIINEPLIFDKNKYYINMHIDTNDFPNTTKIIKKEDGTIEKNESTDIPHYILL
jgi:hypothetical protein